MKIHTPLVLVGMLLTASLSAQNNCSIIEEFDQIFSVKKESYGEREFLNQRVNTLDSSSCFAGLINNNKGYLNYLRQNFAQLNDYDALLALEDSNALQSAYLSSLKSNADFIELLTPLAQLSVDPAAVVKDSISLNQLLNIAVKYFSIKGLTEDGNYIGKVCAGINGIKQTEEVRQPHLEAFCFNAILRNYRSEDFSMYDEFVKSLKELYSLNLGVEPEEKLLRAQGAMYMLMRNNESLRAVLIKEYEEKKQYLPFVLI